MTLALSSRENTPPVAGKWVRKPQARPDEVLAAALDLFTINGFASTRMDDIAKAAGLSKAAIYLYFPSKDDVFKALVEQRVVLLRETVSQAGGLDHTDPIKGLRAIARAWALANADARMAALPRIVLTEAHRFPDLAAFYHTTIIERTHGVLVDLIENGLRQGLFRPLDPTIVARALMGPLLFETLRRQAFGGIVGGNKARDTSLTHMADTLFDLFLAGICVRAPCVEPASNKDPTP